MSTEIKKTTWLEIINPSDKAHISGEDQVAAIVAISVISKGSYGLENEEGEMVLPMLFLNAKEDVEKWLSDNLEGSQTLDDWMDKNPDRLITALRTVTYGSKAECDSQALALSLIESPENRQKFIDANEDARRSSMNAIVTCCRKWADKLEAVK